MVSDQIPNCSFVRSVAKVVADFGKYPTIKDLGHTTDSDSSFHQVTKWIKDCENNHPKCVRKHIDRKFVPTRLIDLGLAGASIPERFPIVETAKNNIQGPYITLSHCWGKSDFVKLESKTFDAFTTSGVPIEKLKTNQNFVGAVTLALKLNVRYIWIDSLCIKQSDKEDWDKEGDLMHKVYRNSFCNIAAAASSDGTKGLFRSRDENDIRKMIPVSFVPEKNNVFLGRKNWVVVSARVYEDLLLQSPLYRRAWVFQGNSPLCHAKSLQTTNCILRRAVAIPSPRALR